MHDDIEPAEGDSPDRGRQLRLVVLIVVFVVFAAIALDNTQRIEIGWVVGDVRVPLVVALVASFALGGLVGLLLGRRHRD